MSLIFSKWWTLSLLSVSALSLGFLLRTWCKFTRTSKPWNLTGHFLFGRNHDFFALSQLQKQQRYAVIYGAGSLIGQAFGKYLIESASYGLILIDFSMEKLRAAETFLRDHVKFHLPLKFILLKCHTGRLDEVSDAIENGLQGE